MLLITKRKKTETSLEKSRQSNLHTTLLLMILSITSGLLIASIYWIFGLASTIPYSNVTIAYLLIFLLFVLLIVEWQLFPPKNIFSWLSIISKLLSVASSLILVLITLTVYLSTKYDISNMGIGALFILLPYLLFIYILPWLLVIPITSVVCKITLLILDEKDFSNESSFFLSIPLTFNILGAAAFIIAPFILGFYHYRDVTATIINEQLSFTNQIGLTYEVALNVKNPSQMDVSGVKFFLVTYKSKDDKSIPSFMEDILGSNESSNTFPIGESKIFVKMPVYVNDNYPQCKDGSLEKPLYLLYSVGNTFRTLEVSNDLNKKILETVCDPAYRQAHGMQ